MQFTRKICANEGFWKMSKCLEVQFWKASPRCRYLKFYKSFILQIWNQLCFDASLGCAWNANQAASCVRSFPQTRGIKGILFRHLKPYLAKAFVVSDWKYSPICDWLHYNSANFLLFLHEWPVIIWPPKVERKWHLFRSPANHSAHLWANFHNWTHWQNPTVGLCVCRYAQETWIGQRDGASFCWFLCLLCLQWVSEHNGNTT